MLCITKEVEPLPIRSDQKLELFLFRNSRIGCLKLDRIGSEAMCTLIVFQTTSKFWDRSYIIGSDRAVFGVKRAQD